MSYRTLANRRPVKQIRIQPGGLQVKYPSSLRPSPLRVWAWKQVQAAEEISTAVGSWVMRTLISWRHGLRTMANGMALRDRLNRFGTTAKNSVSKTAAALWRAFTARAAGRPIGPQPSEGIHTRSAQVMSEHAPGSSATERQLVSRSGNHSEQDREGTRAFLVEELMEEEEKLNRIAAKVVRLQTLIRAREQQSSDAGDPGHVEKQFGDGFQESSYLVGVGRDGRSESMKVRRFHHVRES